MARLTRTQKYASLRDELVNDKETSTMSQDLSGYADRFNNVRETLSPESVVNTAAQTDNTWQPYVENKQTTSTNWQNFFNEPSVQPAKPVQAQPVRPVEVAPVEIRPVEVKPVEVAPVEIRPVEVKPVEVAPAPARPVNVAPAPVKPVEVTPVQPKQEENNSYYDSFMSAPAQKANNSDAFDFNSLFESANTYKAEEKPQEVFNDVVDKTEENISKKERDNYLGEAISDANIHNMVNGEQSLNQIIDNAVNEVRHTENVAPVVEETPTFAKDEPLDADAIKVEEPKNNSAQSDEEFFNTVTVEISKIMDQMTSEPVQEVKQPEPVQEVKQPKPVQEVKVQEPVKVAPVEEKPEEVVEIKNISELKQEPTKDTVSTTIPFVVTNNDEDEIEDDEEEDGSNTILNIILIVLIIILVAVLGLIIFYILKTKGIL